MKTLPPQRYGLDNPPSLRFPSVWLRRVLVAPLWVQFYFLFATRPGRKLLRKIAPENFDGWHTWMRADYSFIPFKQFEKDATDYSIESGALFVILPLGILDMLVFLICKL